jgi:hypothetical protein
MPVSARKLGSSPRKWLKVAWSRAPRAISDPFINSPLGTHWHAAAADTQWERLAAPPRPPGPRRWILCIAALGLGAQAKTAPQKRGQMALPKPPQAKTAAGAVSDL